MKIVPMKVELLDHMGSDLSVVNAARVSFNKESNWENSEDEYKGFEDGLYCAKHPEFKGILQEKDEKLLTYLARHGHWSPFAHTSLQFRIKAPICVARQLVKHQVGGTWNEVSRRYVDGEPEFFFPDIWRGRPVNAKQGSDGVFDMKFFVEGNKEIMDVHSTNLCYSALQLYTQAVHNGMAPEQARMILPQNTMTEWIWTGSLMFFARVCKLRLDPHAQEETRQVAQQIAALVPEEFKHSWKALLE